MYKTKITFFNNFCLPSVSVKEKNNKPCIQKLHCVFGEFWGKNFKEFFYLLCISIITKNEQQNSPQKSSMTIMCPIFFRQ